MCVTKYLHYWKWIRHIIQSSNCVPARWLKQRKNVMKNKNMGAGLPHLEYCSNTVMYLYNLPHMGIEPGSLSWLPLVLSTTLLSLKKHLWNNLIIPWFTKNCFKINLIFLCYFILLSLCFYIVGYSVRKI